MNMMGRAVRTYLIQANYLVDGDLIMTNLMVIGKVIKVEEEEDYSEFIRISYETSPFCKRSVVVFKEEVVLAVKAE